MKILPNLTYKFIKPSFKGYITGGIFYNPREEVRKSGRRAEETTGTYHPNQTYKVYYADPLENDVPESIKEQVDFIIYDDEPALSDMDETVSKMYFLPPIQDAEANFSNELRKFREYFYRLEMMDRKAIGEYDRKIWNNIDVEDSKAKVAYFKSHVEDAQYNQETAGNCDRIFNESRELRDRKNALYYQMKDIEFHIGKRSEDIEKVAKELEQRKELDSILKSKIEVLESKRDALEDIIGVYEVENAVNNKGIQSTSDSVKYNDRNHTEYTSHSINYEDFLAKPISIDHYSKINAELNKDVNTLRNEKNWLYSLLNNAKNLIEKYNADLKANAIILSKVDSYSKRLPDIINDLKSQLADSHALYEKTKAELIPHFENLKNYFQQRGIRSIK